ncbi:MAG: contractile injection system protein, VgrG/Pvc8 family [Pseudomonadota bacterium]
MPYLRGGNDELFKEGNPVEIQIGYRDNLETLFKGEITGLEPEFPNGDPPILVVRGYDRRHRLMRTDKTRSFVNMKDSDVASQIAGEAGLTPEVEDTQVTLDYVLQHNQTDLEFLQERARRIGYEVVVSGGSLHFRKRRNDRGADLTLTRQVELLEFYPRLTTLSQVEEVVVRGWNPKEKKEFVASSKAGDESSRMGGDASGPATVRRAFGGTGGVSVATPVESQAEADQIARRGYEEMALRYVSGDGVCIGQPDLRAGQVVDIQGLGKRFSGSYYVTSTEHTYKRSIGYRTAFSARRNST